MAGKIEFPKTQVIDFTTGAEIEYKQINFLHYINKDFHMCLAKHIFNESYFDNIQVLEKKFDGLYTALGYALVNNKARYTYLTIEIVL